MSVIAIQTPGRIRDLLAYQALIMKAAHDYEALHGCLMMHTLDRSWLQYQAWSTPDQTIWSQYFSHALPRRVNSNVLAVGPYGESNAEESERIAPAKAPSWKDRPCPYSQYALICLRWLQKPRLHVQARLLSCHGPHREPHCPTKEKGVQKHRTSFWREGGPSAGGQ